MLRHVGVFDEHIHIIKALYSNLITVVFYDGQELNHIPIECWPIDARASYCYHCSELSAGSFR